MDKREILEKIRANKLVPVIRTKTANQARRAVEVLAKNGISVFEITMTVPNAVEIIEEFAGKDLLIGAGTVTSSSQAKDCVAVGARFIVGPAFDHDSVEFCVKNNIVVMPGCLTPTEVLAAHNAGADCIKVFPCSALGGAKYLKTLKTLFPEIEMMPTGGVNVGNVADFFAAGAFAVGVGADLVNIDAIEGGYDEEIGAKAREYLENIRS
ncbi:MAG: bifunctional 4-hydroxy-2-oxoglutarate aldolase/2-dehydro-3-deoxy-phosphogluconate aldolase [Pyrinomonadaceae bacterium]